VDRVLTRGAHVKIASCTSQRRQGLGRWQYQSHHGTYHCTQCSLQCCSQDLHLSAKAPTVPQFAHTSGDGLHMWMLHIHIPVNYQQQQVTSMILPATASAYCGVTNAAFVQALHHPLHVVDHGPPLLPAPQKLCGSGPANNSTSAGTCTS
jgi:hypothetical protein